MSEVLKKAVAYIVRYQCDKLDCGGEMLPKKVAYYLAMPIKGVHDHVCNKCGTEVISQLEYPYLDYREET